MSLISLALLVLWLVLAAAGYWYGFRNPAEGMLRSLFQGTFFVSLFILVPVTLYVIWGGMRQEPRLSAHGIVPHPSLQELLTEPVVREGAIQWVYTAGDPAGEILEFYRWKSNRPGWTIGSDRTVQLVLSGNGRTLIISAEDAARGSVVSYLLRKE